MHEVDLELDIVVDSRVDSGGAVNQGKHERDVVLGSTCESCLGWQLNRAPG